MVTALPQSPRPFSRGHRGNIVHPFGIWTHYFDARRKRKIAVECETYKSLIRIKNPNFYRGMSWFAREAQDRPRQLTDDEENPMRRINDPTIASDGFALVDYPQLRSAEFQAQQAAVYDTLRPGENAANKLARAIRWGIYADGEFTWLYRNEYRLDALKNPEEKGNVRRFVLIPEPFLRRPELQDTLVAIFDRWQFEQGSTLRAYEVQLSAIRYEPTLAMPALPSPIVPHQDEVDGAVVVLRKTPHLLGGTSRIYSLNERPLYEFDIEPGEALFIRDAQLKHQVTPLLLDTGDGWRPGERAFRDILIVRFQPVGR